MKLAYRDALQEVLEAVRAGEEIESAIAGQADADELRADVEAAGAIARLAEAAPRPAPAVRTEGARRMQAQLQAETARSRAGRVPAGSRRPGFVLAALVAVAAVVGAALLIGGSGTSVEAASIQGVVVDNAGGRLAVQTQEALELVRVPADTPVSDPAGRPLELEVIGAGQVVVIDIERSDREVMARRVERRVDSIEAWCAGLPERCRALSDRLDDARAQCERREGLCDVAVAQLEQLRARAATVARLEGLKQACREGVAGACRDLAGACPDAGGLCGDAPPGATPSPAAPPAVDSLKRLQEACRSGDAASCRRLEQLCAGRQGICPLDPASEPADVIDTPTTAPAQDPRPAPELATPVFGPVSATPEGVRPDPPDSPTPTSIPATPTPGVTDVRPLAPPRDAAPPAATPTPEDGQEPEVTVMPRDSEPTPAPQPSTSDFDTPAGDGAGSRR